MYITCCTELLHVHKQVQNSSLFQLDYTRTVLFKLVLECVDGKNQEVVDYVETVHAGVFVSDFLT